MLRAKYLRDGVLEVFKTVLLNPSHHFFGITGDIDDLGVFVARYGRAHAENLVDFVSVIAENYFLDWCEKHGSQVTSFDIVPGGEEILVLGTCTEEQCLRELFSSCRREINLAIRDSKYFPCGDLTISFGCVLFRVSTLTPLINQLLTNGNNQTTDYQTYLEIMYTIRRALAVCLDLEKFKTFKHDIPELAIAYRNLVYFDLLRHKARSRNLLTLAANRWGSPSYTARLEFVWDDYGMHNGRTESMSVLVEALESELCMDVTKDNPYPVSCQSE